MPKRSLSPLSIAYVVMRLPWMMKSGKTTLKNQFQGLRRTRIWMSKNGYTRPEAESFLGLTRKVEPRIELVLVRLQEAVCLQV